MGKRLRIRFLTIHARIFRSTSPSWSSALTSSPVSTSVSALPVVVTPRRSTPSVRPSPSPLSPTTRSTSMSTPRTSWSRLLLSTTAHSWLPTTAVPSPRSSVVAVPAPVTRSPTVKFFFLTCYAAKGKRKVYGNGEMEYVCLHMFFLSRLISMTSWWTGDLGGFGDVWAVFVRFNRSYMRSEDRARGIWENDLWLLFRCLVDMFFTGAVLHGWKKYLA